jgi:hypothetical protein
MKKWIVIVLGVMTIAELVLSADIQSNDESQKHRVIMKSNAVQFINNKGATEKEISLEPESKVVLKKERAGKIEKDVKVKQLINKNAKTSKNCEYIAVIENAMDRSYIDEQNKEREIYEGGEETSNISLYDQQGNLLYEQQLPEGQGAGGDILISDNGNVTALMTWNTAIEDRNEPKHLIHVFDRNGKEILRIPSIEDMDKYKKMNILEMQRLSPNGKYLAINTRLGHNHNYFTRFYNLENKRYWDSSKNYYVYEISDDGLAVVGSKKFPGKESPIDLRKYIGE